MGEWVYTISQFPDTRCSSEHSLVPVVMHTRWYAAVAVEMVEGIDMSLFRGSF